MPRRVVEHSTANPENDEALAVSSVLLGPARAWNYPIGPALLDPNLRGKGCILCLRLRGSTSLFVRGHDTAGARCTVFSMAGGDP